MKLGSSGMKSISKCSQIICAAVIMLFSSLNCPRIILTSLVLLSMTTFAKTCLSSCKCLELPCIIYTQTHRTFLGYQSFFCSYFVHYF